MSISILGVYSPVSHNPFLLALASILPEKCCPLIVTDAGCRNNWFREVEIHGWFWICSVRGEVGFKRRGSGTWRSNKLFYPSANAKARYLGHDDLGRKRPIDAHLHLYKAKSKGRRDSRSSKAGRHHTAQATNLPANAMASKQLANLYSKRMQIKKIFRDIKSPQYGLGLRHSNSRRTKRLDILLLIAMLAVWVLRFIGLIATKQDWSRCFQARTIRIDWSYL